MMDWGKKIFDSQTESEYWIWLEKEAGFQPSGEMVG